MRQPYAYLRKSRIFRDKDVVSPEMQLAQVTDLAARHGDTNLVVLTDLNLSGRSSKRPGFTTLIEQIAAGNVSAVYSYSLSRLSRSIKAIVELAEVCDKQNVAIRLARDIDPDPTTASGRLVLNLLAATAQFEADVAAERARDTVAARRARGDKLGPPFYERPELVVDAYRQARSFVGAAKLLNERGTQTRSGKVWLPTPVRDILIRVAPELLTLGPSRGASQATPFAFARLLRCRCGSLLTGSAGRTGWRRYHCYRGSVTAHVKGSINENIIMAWARAEADLLEPPAEVAVVGEERQRSALLDRKRLLNKALLNGMPENEYDAEMESVDADLARQAGREVRLSRVVWEAAPALVNAQLRALWQEVEMDEHQRPVRAIWRFPQWRRTLLPRQG